MIFENTRQVSNNATLLLLVNNEDDGNDIKTYIGAIFDCYTNI